LPDPKKDKQSTEEFYALTSQSIRDCPSRERSHLS